eukprot:TRINITY_DN116572_c0_g1_i1.p1 TRINITY_DN116572_c0_g1~~TRINITY_DN116572_c0_g1_i1.p1  ORF type:complete len:245 (+),score=72.21 TRINITY_DN116572_c0_g1_i1:74-808(+)
MLPRAFGLSLAWKLLFGAAVEVSEYARQQYWDEYYAGSGDDGKYDWYIDWNSSEALPGGMRGVLEAAGVQRSGKLLHVGCGNSVISEALWDDGYSQVTHVDLSPVVIEQMGKRLKHTGHEFLVADATALQFEAASFDAVFDKGALDAILTGSKKKGQTAIREIARVLKPQSGVLILVSMGEPRRRLKDLEFPNRGLMPVGDDSPKTFSCETQEIRKKHTVTHIYICRPAAGDIQRAAAEKRTDL